MCQASWHWKNSVFLVSQFKVLMSKSQTGASQIWKTAKFGRCIISYGTCSRQRVLKRVSPAWSRQLKTESPPRSYPAAHTTWPPAYHSWQPSSWSWSWWHTPCESLRPSRSWRKGLQAKIIGHISHASCVSENRERLQQSECSRKAMRYQVKRAWPARKSQTAPHVQAVSEMSKPTPIGTMKAVSAWNRTLSTWMKVQQLVDENCTISQGTRGPRELGVKRQAWARFRWQSFWNARFRAMAKIWQEVITRSVIKQKTKVTKQGLDLDLF